MSALNAQFSSLPNLNVLTVSIISLLLNDLFDKRLEVAEQKFAGKLYLPILRTVHTEISALPPHILGGVPFAAALSEASHAYDSFGTALWHFAEFAQALPNASPESKAIIRKAQSIFIPERSVLQRSYAEKASTHIELMVTFEKLKAEFATVSMLDGRTLADLVQDFLNASIQIFRLLSSRATATQSASRRAAKSLRTRAVSALHSFRSAHIDEITAELTPATSFKQVWNYIHMLAEQRDKPTPQPKPPEKT